MTVLPHLSDWYAVRSAKCYAVIGESHIPYPDESIVEISFGIRRHQYHALLHLIERLFSETLVCRPVILWNRMKTMQKERKKPLVY